MQFKSYYITLTSENGIGYDSCIMPRKYTKKKVPPAVSTEVPVELPVQETVAVQSNGKLLIVSVAILLLLVAVLPSAYFYAQYKKTQSMLSNPAVLGQKEVDGLIQQVGKLIDLPSENPTVATVSDKSKLANQTFFARAENGDKVLIFPKAQKAILYRPSINKLIEVGPVNIQPTSAPNELGAAISVTPAATTIAPSAKVITPSAALTPTVTLKRIAVLNGTNINGLTKQTADKLTQGVKDVTVTIRGNAQKHDYKETVVVDLTENNIDKTKEIATFLNGQVGALPEGESKPDADILIIAAE